ncbi:MAG: rhodanese-like domain-containing protein [Chthoniobacteraceae bacterium]
MTLLDTRNDYEVKLGTFQNALPIGVDQFRNFPAAVAKLPEEMKEQPIVMFCTGGIRCEKAGPYMESVGFQKIFQLDGGILKYFEECGGAHYDGECFVFDLRTGVDPALQETESIRCYACQTPLDVADQSDPRYVPNISCRYCFKEPGDQRAAELARHRETLRRLSTPLPGCVPYDNFRPLNIPFDCDGLSLAEAFAHIAKSKSREEWGATCAAGLVVNDRHEPMAADRLVRAGERYLHKYPGLTEPEVNAAIEILHEDEALVVLNKPAPLPMHPGGRFNRNTLQYLLRADLLPAEAEPGAPARCQYHRPRAHHAHAPFCQPSPAAIYAGRG